MSKAEKKIEIVLTTAKSVGVATSEGDKFGGDVVTLPEAEANGLISRGKAKLAPAKK